MSQNNKPVVYVYDFDEDKLFFGKDEYIGFCCDNNIDPDYNETTEFVLSDAYEALKAENEKLVSALGFQKQFNKDQSELAKREMNKLEAENEKLQKEVALLKSEYNDILEPIFQKKLQQYKGLESQLATLQELSDDMRKAYDELVTKYEKLANHNADLMEQLTRYSGMTMSESDARVQLAKEKAAAAKLVDVLLMCKGYIEVDYNHERSSISSVINAALSEYKARGE